MNQPNPTRRDVLQAGVAALAWGMLWPAGSQAAAPQVEAITEVREPERIGELTRDDKRILWQHLAALSEIWEMRRLLTLNRTGFDEFLALRTSEEPSYYSEYVSAAALLNKLDLPTRNTPRRLAAFLRGKEPPQGVSADDFDRLRRWVSAEFVTVVLIHGGFRALPPLVNIQGYSGGRWSGDGELPYRTAAGEQ